MHRDTLARGANSDETGRAGRITLREKRRTSGPCLDGPYDNKGRNLIRCEQGRVVVHKRVAFMGRVARCGDENDARVGEVLVSIYDKLEGERILFKTGFGEAKGMVDDGPAFDLFDEDVRVNFVEGVDPGLNTETSLLLALEELAGSGVLSSLCGPSDGGDVGVLGDAAVAAYGTGKHDRTVAVGRPELVFDFVPGEIPVLGFNEDPIFGAAVEIPVLKIQHC